MFKTISRGIQYPAWVGSAGEDCRFRRLDLYDRLLDGKFYDHIVNSFYDETAGTTTIPIKNRRPSVQFRMLRMVARWSGRKLFSGRHVPRVMHPDEKAQKLAHDVIVKSRFYIAMNEAVLRGSVGSIALTFRVDGEKVGLTVWKARDCDPVFDGMGVLKTLRVRYVTSGASLRAMSAPNVESNLKYWFVRDFTADREVTYIPVLASDWNPYTGFTDAKRSFQEWPEQVFNHGLGFVPGEWIRNLAGGDEIDGACTWEDAIPISIELDYMLSQTCRGTRYNCAPQLVVKGEVTVSNEPGSVDRKPTDYIHVQASHKDADGGDTMGDGDAKLLEMAGTGTETALKLIERLHDFGLEVIAAPRKDPQRVKGVLSGHAMEHLDSDSHDLVMELRSSYGDYGALPLLRKIISALDKGIDVEKFSLRWPRLNTPTADDIARLFEGISNALNPLKIQYKADDSGKMIPAVPEEYFIIPLKKAQMYMESELDLALIGAEGDSTEDIEQSNDDNPPPPSGSVVDDEGPKDVTEVPQGSVSAPVRVET